MATGLYDELKLHFIIMRIFGLNYIRYDDKTSKLSHDNNLVANMKFGILMSVLIVLAWYCLRNMFQESDNLYNMFAKIIEFILVFGLMISIACVIFKSQHKFIELLSNIQNMEDNMQFLGLKVVKRVYYKCHHVYDNFIIVFSLGMPLLSLFSFMCFKEMKDVPKAKILYVCIYAFLLMPKMLFVFITERCKALNNALDFNLNQICFNCGVCNNIECVRFEGLCPLHTLCCAEVLYVWQRTMMENAILAFKLLYCLFMIAMVLETGVDMISLLYLYKTGTHDLSSTVTLLVTFLLFTVIGVLVFYMTLDISTREFAHTGSIVSRYYSRFWKTSGVSGVVRRFSLNILEEMDLLMYIFNFEKEYSLRNFHTSSMTSSVISSFKIKLI